MTEQLVYTDDGSVTFYAPEYQDHYHSTKGALSEAMHIFIGYGLNEVLKFKKSIHILDVGFGTGLNALCAFSKLINLDVNVLYTAIEPFPLEKGNVELLNYPEMLGAEELLRNALVKMHTAPIGDEVVIHKNFRFRLFHDKLEFIDLSDKTFDLIFFDPFKPDSDSILWSSEIFSKLYRATVLGGILVTYSSKGTVRRAMQDAGFETHKLPGPDGKREITRALRL